MYHVIPPNGERSRWRGNPNDSDRDDLATCPHCWDEFDPSEGHECADAKCAICGEHRHDKHDGGVVEEMIQADYDALRVDIPASPEDRKHVAICQNCDETRWTRWDLSRDDLVVTISEMAKALGICEYLHPELILKRIKER